MWKGKESRAGEEQPPLLPPEHHTRHSRRGLFSSAGVEGAKSNRSASSGDADDLDSMICALPGAMTPPDLRSPRPAAVDPFRLREHHRAVSMGEELQQALALAQLPILPPGTGHGARPQLHAVDVSHAVPQALGLALSPSPSPSSCASSSSPAALLGSPTLSPTSSEGSSAGSKRSTPVVPPVGKAVPVAISRSALSPLKGPFALPPASPAALLARSQARQSIIQAAPQASPPAVIDAYGFTQAAAASSSRTVSPFMSLSKPHVSHRSNIVFRSGQT